MMELEKNYDYIEYKSVELYNVIVNKSKNIAKCYTQKNKHFIGYMPNMTLPPKTICLKLDIKTFKKNIILNTLLKLKEQDKLIINTIDINFVDIILSNESLVKYNKLKNKNNLLNIDYNNVVDNIYINIVDDCINNVFYTSKKINNVIYINKNQFITPTIIITSLEKIYYWKLETSKNMYNNLKILIIHTNNKINNKIDINYYDIIIIRNDLFVNFIKTNCCGEYNNDIIYNRLIIDDLFVKNNTIQFTNYQNCLEIIFIIRKYSLCSNMINVYGTPNTIFDQYTYNHIKYYYILRDVINKDFQQLYMTTINDDTKQYDNYYYDCISVKKCTYNICVLTSTNNDKEIMKIKQVLEYHIDEIISNDFIINILKHIFINNDETDNIILKLMYELYDYYNDYDITYKKLEKLKNDMINEFNIIKNNISNKNNDNVDIMLTKLNDNYSHDNYQNVNIICVSSLMLNNIKFLLNNIEKYSLLPSNVYTENKLNSIINNYTVLINIINNYMLNIHVFMQKIENYLSSFKRKLKHSVVDNKCIVCNSKIEFSKQVIYTCCYHNTCDSCDSYYINACVYCNKTYDKIKINNEIFLNNNIENIYYNTFNCDIKNNSYNDIIISNIGLKQQNILLNLINHITNTNKTYKIFIYCNCCENTSKILINNNISYKTLEGTYYQQEKILDNLSNTNKNMILLQCKTNITASINYDNVNFIIFYYCRISNIKNYKFIEIERFFKKYKKTNKTFYYIL